MVWAVLALVAAGPARAQGSLEYPVKAAYLYKFGPFVEWPPAAFEGAAAPVVLCVVGDDPCGAALDRAVEGQHVGARPIVVRRIERLERGSGCHIAYLAGSAVQSVAEGLAGARGAGVLTVTDASREGGARGIIHFVIKDNRVRFHIDEQAAARNGITISSKLLSLALSVRTRKARG
jgi:hypothetical protein